MARTIQERIGRRVMLLRMAAGMTQLELADKLEMKQSFVARFEAGNFKVVDPEKIEKMAEVLNTRPGVVLCNEPLTIDDFEPAELALVSA